MANFDLTPFDITTPKPKPGGTTALTVPGHRIDEVREFARYEEGCAVLWAPTSGATTASVNRTRCEVKGKPFYLADGVKHIARLTSQVQQVNWKGSFVLIQAHCHDGNDPTLKGFIETKDRLSGVFKVGLRIAPDPAAPPKQVVFEPVDLAQPFTVQVCLHAGGKVEVGFEQEGCKEMLSAWLSDERAARPHVFHMGAYNQVDQGHESEPATDGTLLRIVDILECHEQSEGTPPLDGAAFNAMIDHACTLPRQAMLLELNRITDLIDEADLPDDVSGPLYLRIKAIKGQA
ncbi:polysaccharide lyase family 7 protein [Pseudomonas sp. RIT-PI-S]|uniref:polysaccharide lyase family 7 protein n=1 Tax=Pseudomonas sp. RIT-PI-S TaxID=3035295 RepID=UPI0021D89C73|nr:polysaccharide lyase family 7 protein [Pseudomonas sp. RIT-PI-S]